MSIFTFYEFFAGGGMARAGLGPAWSCTFANEIDQKKSAIYRKNWGDVGLKVADVKTLSTADLPGTADLAWASFPCQDLSLAGAGAGLRGHRSGAFWPFWHLLRELNQQNRAPNIVVAENVCGMLSSHDGTDFAAICSAYVTTGYRVGAIVVDAVHFLPQSRPRLFVIGVRGVVVDKIDFGNEKHNPLWHSRSLLAAHHNLPPSVRKKWIWWDMQAPPAREGTFTQLIEDRPQGVRWHSQKETSSLLKMMSPLNLKKVEEAKLSGVKVVGTIHKRMRPDDSGRTVQRAEVRFDNVAGCLRTPAGGSSRQIVMVVEGESVRSRLISPLETARLMGLPPTYSLPAKYNEAYHLTGDGVAVPVVRYLADQIFERLLKRGIRVATRAA